MLEQSPADGCCGSQPLEEQFLENVARCASESRLCLWERLRLEMGEKGLSRPLPGLPGAWLPHRGCLAAGAGLAGLPELEAGAGSLEGKYLLLLLFPRASFPGKDV